MRRLLGSGLLPALLPASALASVAGEPRIVPVHPGMIAPFVALLLAIAVFPFLHRRWWEKNYPLVAIGLGLVTIGYYVGVLDNTPRLLQTAHEYVSFICLIGSLFVVAGGIHIRIRGRSSPRANVFLLLVGAVLSNLIGTTGASMVLIRPYLRVNRYRIRPFHVVFFIFIVSNIGGALTPIGDPPLFLGYLKGVPFFWVVQELWFPWMLTVAAVLGVFFLLDTRSYRNLPAGVRREVDAAGEEGQAAGAGNLLFLAVILVAVFVTDPPFLREVLMLGAAAGSYATTGRDIHRQNEFNVLPIKEVALLFFGIFATMIPALDWLQLHAHELGIKTPGQFYWTTGGLSAVLDNAPTYLNSLSLQLGLFADEASVREVLRLARSSGAAASGLAEAGPAVRAALEVLLRTKYELVAAGAVGPEESRIALLLGNHPLHLASISLAAVFFGACTYIGNGPNFMVKSIAEQSGVRCPSFFAYIAFYVLPVLLPVFTLVWLLFFSPIAVFH
ncbi:MAG: sodium:proton antiporter [Bacteroidota bacterium]